MELNYDCNNDANLTARMNLIIAQCAPIFYEADGKAMGIGEFTLVYVSE